MRTNLRNTRFFGALTASLVTLAIGIALTWTLPAQGKGKPGGGGGGGEPNWEYMPEEGGWLDWNTGLVWGENAEDLFRSLDPENNSMYGLGSWDYANEEVLPAYRYITGFDDWRFPTAAELTDAANKNYTDYAFPAGANPYQVVTWTSDGSPKWRVLGDLVTGETHRTLQERSSIPLTPVRRAFTP